MRRNRKKGAVIILALVALSLFVLGAIGLAVDGSHLYAQRQMAQAAADAAATAAIYSIYSRTNTTDYNNDFAPATLNCDTANANKTPCYYSRLNGFDEANGDTVIATFPTSVPGVALSASFSPAAVQVTVRRPVNTTLMRMLGPTFANVAASATAGILEVVVPVPIIVLHPTLNNAFLKSGTSSIKICGGPTKSIQVNSAAPVPGAPSSDRAVRNNGTSGVVDLSEAGPAPPPPFTPPPGSTCNGQGGDFGVFGLPTSPPPSMTLLLGTEGQYVQPDGPIHDPLKDVPVPVQPPLSKTSTASGADPITVPNGVYGCPSGTDPAKPCRVFYPGLYPKGITEADTANHTSLFAPGIYYILSEGFHGGANSIMLMANCNAPSRTDLDLRLTGTSPDSATDCGMLVYNTGNGNKDIFEVGANGSASLVGPPINGVYKGVLFFEDHDAAAHNSTAGAGSKPHRLGGGGSLSLVGTIYLTNWETCSLADPNCSLMTTTKYQGLDIRGNAGNETRIDGQIIVGTLELGGGGTIQMNLSDQFILKVNQIALVR